MNTTTENNSRQAYNVKVTPLSLDFGTNARGTRKITGRATWERRDGKTFERTIVAQGKAADAVADMLKIGEQTTVRAFFDRAPANDDGKGGEFITIIAKPKAKAA